MIHAGILYKFFKANSKMVAGHFVELRSNNLLSISLFCGTQIPYTFDQILIQ